MSTYNYAKPLYCFVVINFQDRLETDVQSNLDEADQLRTETNDTRFRIEDLMADIERMAQDAEAKLVQLEQPVGFNYDSYEVLDNPSGGLRPLLFNEIRLDFRYATPNPQGLIFFVENTDSQEVIALQIVNGQLMFEFNNANEVLRLFSKAELCSNCWFRVIATR